MPTIRTVDNRSVDARLFIEGDKGRIVVYFHGNGETVDHMHDELRALVGSRCRLLLVNAYGYGVDDTVASPVYLKTLLSRNMKAVHDYLLNERLYTPENIIWLGHSYGSTSACLAPSLTKPHGALILHAGYNSLAGVVGNVASKMVGGIIGRMRGECAEPFRILSHEPLMWTDAGLKPLAEPL